ncbi:electron transporter, putative [Ricinus communis]|uniref:Electron transporter, putative n=1 Tax=Ricinus communis TaxID=3988 RepID=B9RL44_RICCO|nr:electron transporter, putative [Ricinus communis]|eukprot:XP_002514463.1 uncharacterized protein LOC8285433 [Ricinus communis]
MKGMKGKLLKKLKTIKPIGYLKQDRVLLVNAADGFVETLSKIPIFKSQAHFTPEKPDEDQERGKENTGILVINQEPDDIIDVSELMKDLEEDEMEVDEDKENIGPLLKQGNDPVGVVKDNMEDTNSVKMELSSFRQTPLSEIDISSFRRPDLNSGTLFDPNLLAAFEQAVKEHIRMSEAERQARTEKENIERSKEEERFEQENVESNKLARLEEENPGNSQEPIEIQARIEEVDLEEEPPLKTRRIEAEEEEEDNDPLLGFEEKCPPGGSDSVILYTTTLRGVRKTFEDCNSIRFLLESFRVIFYERDVSMHTEYKEELWRVLEGKILPPRLFIKGRHIGGAEEVLRLHEQGKFRQLFQGIPADGSIGRCEGCAGFRFVLCFHCNGSHRVVEDDGLSRNCQDCNENGLIICPLCC